jgi:two-component sensor histidine kinase
LSDQRLYAAPKQIDRGVMCTRGSVHGEIGQTQFLPKNILAYGTGDLDVAANALNSTANFLKAHGWSAGAGYQPGEANFADHIQFLMHEISHRSKNLLSVIQSIARRTARTARTMEEFEGRFERRLQGLAASHDVLVGKNWQGAPLAELVRQQLGPFVEIQSSRFEFVGPDIVVTADAAQAIGLAIHELATNAIKYGALSAPTGKVRISWMFDGNAGASSKLSLNWIEQGGPPATPPSREGFGHVVIVDMIERSLNGKVAVEFAVEGLKWSVSMPATNLVSDQSD